MDTPVKPDSGNSVAQAIDGAIGDWSMSGDAMRWSPELAEQGPAAGDLRVADVGTGLGVTSVRRLVSGALTSLGTVASEVVNDVVSELRQLTRGSSDDER
jgi:hypothetical protein